MRNAFIDELVLAAEVNDRIVLIVGDLGYGVVEPFANRFPERFSADRLPWATGFNRVGRADRCLHRRS